MKIIDFSINDIKTKNNEIFQSKICNIKRQIQSSNMNIILGAGFSYGVAQLLGSVEKRLYEAEHIHKDHNEVIAIKKEFFEKSILPMADKIKLTVGEDERIRFLELIKKIVNNRQSSILHKIVNIFTTNYDLLIETALEKIETEYFDGFSGKLNPIFSTANYGMILNHQTSISSMTSEITTFNLYKVHGSLNWDCKDSKIVNSNHIEKITTINDHISCSDFEDYYNTLAIVNPSKEKLKQTVLDVNYYDQLRMFCNELEKNNSILISFGFSFEDEHILQMTQRALKGNPTFSLLLFSYNDASTKKYENIFSKFPNVTLFQLVEMVDDKKTVAPFTQKYVNDIFEEIYNGTK